MKKLFSPLLVVAFLLLFTLKIAEAGGLIKKPVACPHVQAGYVTGVLDEYGNTILEVNYPCEFATMPVLVASPAQSEGTLRVLNFAANSLTGATGSIQVEGLPGWGVTFAWVATLETP